MVRAQSNNLQLSALTIRRACPQDEPVLWSFFCDIGQAVDEGYFKRNFEFQEIGTRVILLAMQGDILCGYCILNWHPKYRPFSVAGFPEIQDLNVHRDWRRCGIATALIHHCEDLARKEGAKTMGIGVGLDSSFGPAQRLYVNLGYVPDGQGLNYDREPVSQGEFHPVDENLCMMMVKDL